MNHLFPWKSLDLRQDKQKKSVENEVDAAQLASQLAPTSPIVETASFRIDSISSPFSTTHASTTNAINIASIAAQIQERAMLLERECEMVRLASEERDRLLQCYAKEQQQTQAVRRDALEWYIQVHAAELEYNQVMSEIDDYETKISKINQEIVSLKERLRVQQQIWEQNTTALLTQHSVVTELYVKKLHGTIQNRNDCLSRKQHQFKVLREKTSDLQQKSTQAIQAKQDLEKEVEIISAEREKDNREIHDLAERVRNKLEERAQLRNTLRSLKEEAVVPTNDFPQQ